MKSLLTPAKKSWKIESKLPPAVHYPRRKPEPAPNTPQPIAAPRPKDPQDPWGPWTPGSPGTPAPPGNYPHHPKFRIQTPRNPETDKMEKPRWKSSISDVWQGFEFAFVAINQFRKNIHIRSLTKSWTRTGIYTTISTRWLPIRGVGYLFTKLA